jgi:hypothetical protein
MFVATALAKESQDWRVVPSAIADFCLEATDRTSNFHSIIFSNPICGVKMN